MDSTTVTDRGGAGSSSPTGGPAHDPTGWLTGPTSPRRVGQLALALITVQAVFRGWAVTTGFFYEDDFRYVYDASTSPLSADYLLQDYNGHLMPGEFLLVWVLQRLAPMSFGAVAGVLLVLQVAASLMVWLLLRELVGARLGALVPLAVYLFSPLTLGSFLWYAASVQAVPLQLVLAGTLLFHVRHLRSGRWLDAVAGLLWFAVGLLLWEKVLVVLPLVAAVTVLWFSSGNPAQRVFRAVVDHWRLWSVYLLLAVAYLVLYVTRVEWQLSGDGDARSTVELAREAVLNGFVPALFGGPYTGFPTGLGLAPDPPTSVQLVFAQALVLVVAATVVAHRGAWRAWLLLAGYVAVDVLLLASGRIDVLGPIIGRDTRYLADASVVAAVAIALALFPLAGSTWPPRRIELSRGLDRPVVAALVVLVYVNSAWITSLEMVRRWSDTSAEPYVRTAQEDLRRLGDVVVYDRQPPADVLSPWFLEDARVSRILGPLPERPRFDRPTDDLRVADDEGHLRAAVVVGAAESLPGPDPSCGWAATGPDGTTIRMNEEMYPWRWTVRLSYFTGTATNAVVTLGDRDVQVRFKQGLHSVYIVHTGPVGDISVTGVEAGVTVCIPRALVGQI